MECAHNGKLGVRGWWSDIGLENIDCFTPNAFVFPIDDLELESLNVFGVLKVPWLMDSLPLISPLHWWMLYATCGAREHCSNNLVHVAASWDIVTIVFSATGMQSPWLRTQRMLFWMHLSSLVLGACCFCDARISSRTCLMFDVQLWNLDIVCVNRCLACFTCLACSSNVSMRVLCSSLT